LTEKRRRIVLDTNTLISGILFRASVPLLASTRAFEHDEVLSSSATRNELREVIKREKFDRYIRLADRLTIVEDIIEDMVHVNIDEQIQMCRDPKDDKFLDLAVNGNADYIVTGDKDLLSMQRILGTLIISPADYLAQ